MKNSILYKVFRGSPAFLLLLSGCTIAQDSQFILPGANQTKEYLNLLHHKQVGIVVNQTSLVENTLLLDTLLTLGVNLKAIFTPEHGFYGKSDAGKLIDNGTYCKDSIKVLSLYGNKKKPDKQDLQEIDIMVFDLQDVGVRFYTYISTLHYVMEACAGNKIPLIILDRPNPNGFYIDGPMLDINYRSFVGLHPVPIVYGMTIGEYAQMINGEYWLPDSVQCNLTVIKCQNYTHSSYYDLPVAPSPNLRDMRSVYLYPSTCFFEGTVVSEGRGTDSPFCIIGHPNFSDHSFSFIPRSMPGYSFDPKFSGTVCYGIDLRHIPLDSLKDMRTIDLQYLKTFYDNLALGDSFFMPYFDQLAGNNTLRLQIIAGLSVNEIRQSWTRDLETFKKIRAKYLLYPDFSE
jgi:uncharacterized protein YbbC (DUF1343 family)